MTTSDTTAPAPTAKPYQEAVAVPGKIRRLAKARLAAERERRLRNIQGNMRTYLEYLKEVNDKLANADAEAEAEVAKWAEAQARLAKARIKFTTSTYQLRIFVETKRSKLKKVYEAIGKLDPATMMKDIHDGEKGLIKVTIDAAKFPVRVTFVTKLKPTDKCRIVATPVPARTDYDLACERR